MALRNILLLVGLLTVQLVQTVVLIRVLPPVVIVLLDSTRLEKVGAAVELVPQDTLAPVLHPPLLLAVRANTPS